MQYVEYKPTDKLTNYIEYYWSLSVENYCRLSPEILRLPDYAPEWIFDISSPGDSKIVFNFKEGDVLVNEKKRTFGIRFTPYGLAKIGNLNMRAFGGGPNSVNPSDILPILSQRIEETILSTKKMSKIIEQINDILLKQISGSSAIDTIVIKITRDIARKNGIVKVNDVCNLFNVSKTTLNNKLVDLLGISTKKLARIHRFNFLLKRGMQEDITFTKLAHDCGFFDQSHLNHEFKFMTGITPTQFFSYSSSVIERS